MTDEPFVAKEVCDSRTRSMRWVAGVSFGVLSVFLALVVYVAGQATSANAQYMTLTQSVSTSKGKVATQIQAIGLRLDSHQIAQRSHELSIMSKLDEVKTELSEQRKEQRSLLERILQLQVEIAKNHATASR